jgi:hypothetical protein
LLWNPKVHHHHHINQTEAPVLSKFIRVFKTCFTNSKSDTVATGSIWLWGKCRLKSRNQWKAKQLYLMNFIHWPSSSSFGLTLMLRKVPRVQGGYDSKENTGDNQ